MFDLSVLEILSGVSDFGVYMPLFASLKELVGVSYLKKSDSRLKESSLIMDADSQFVVAVRKYFSFCMDLFAVTTVG